MSSKKERLIDLFWNIFILGLINLLVDFVLLFFFHVDVELFLYFTISMVSTFVLVVISSVVIFIRTKDSVGGRLAYSIIAFILSLIFFYLITFWVPSYIPFWIFP